MKKSRACSSEKRKARAKKPPYTSSGTQKSKIFFLVRGCRGTARNWPNLAVDKLATISKEKKHCKVCFFSGLEKSALFSLQKRVLFFAWKKEVKSLLVWYKVPQDEKINGMFFRKTESQARKTPIYVIGDPKIEKIFFWSLVVGARPEIGQIWP